MRRRVFFGFDLTGSESPCKLLQQSATETDNGNERKDRPMRVQVDHVFAQLAALDGSGTAYAVCATTDRGRRFFYSHCELNKAQADALVNRVVAVGSIDEKYWAETDPIYGSEEYDAGGYEMMWAERERVEAAWY